MDLLGITTNYDEWKEQIEEYRKNGLFEPFPSLFEMIYVDEIKNCKYFLQSPVGMFNGYQVYAKSLTYDNLEQLIDECCNQDFIMYYIYSYSNKDDKIYICRGRFIKDVLKNIKGDNDGTK